MSRVFRPPPSAGGAMASFAPVLLVAAIYVYFLLFAQFGLLQGIRANGGSTTEIRSVLAAMAALGLVSSLAAPVLISRHSARSVLIAGLAAASGAGIWAAILFHAGSSSLALMLVCSSLVGAGLGLATVSVAADLRRMTRARKTGIHVGLGTGLAYCFCNLPGVFSGTPCTKAWLAAAMTTGAVLIAIFSRADDPPGRASRPAAADLAEAFVSRRGIALITGVFFALVWFDSAAFAMVQNTPQMRARLWEGAPILWRNGIIHALAAIAAGALLDRGRFQTVAVGALVLLGSGFLLFANRSPTAALAAPLYVSGVSFYSTALVAYAALAPATSMLPAPAWRAGWVYSIGGWVGSATGVGLVEQFGKVPIWALPAVVVVLAFALSQLPGRSCRRRRNA